MDASLHILMTADAAGGVWNYAMELARALQPHGVRITLATMGCAPSAGQRATVAQLGNLTLFVTDYALEWMSNPWDEVDAAGEWLLETEHRLQPDIVHLNGYALAALPWQAPAQVVAHSCVFSWWQAVKHGVPGADFAEYRTRVENGLNAANLVVAPSAAMLEALDEHYAFTGERRVIPNARDAAHFVPRKKLPIILSAGRVWDEAKNVKLLASIAPHLAWPVHIAGPRACPQVAQTNEDDCHAADLGNHGYPAQRFANYLGPLTTTQLSAHLGAASIYAAPAYYEPFGLTVLEAALCGCALVLSDIPSFRENWDGAALFIPPDDAAAWVTALNMLASDDAVRARFGQAARSRGLRFTPRRMAAAYLESYRALLGAHRGLEKREAVAA